MDAWGHLETGTSKQFFSLTINKKERLKLYTFDYDRQNNVQNFYTNLPFHK